MAEYIDRESIYKALAMENPFGWNNDDLAELFRQAKPADVVPVVHGRWEDSTDEWFGTDVYTCSKCRESYVLVEGTPKENLWHYCPNCGAKMESEGE